MGWKLADKAFAAALVFALTPASATAVSALAPAQSTEQLGGPKDLDFFLGEWDIVSHDIQPNGNYAVSRARSHAYRFLDGTSIMDEWRSLDGQGETVFRGASFRTWLPRQQQWQILWMMAGATGETVISGRMKDGEFHMEGHGRDGYGEFLERARYHDISEDSFQFTMDRSYDGGESWIAPFNTFTATRRNRVDSPKE